MQFAAVHDSYWTHACDIEEMHAILREQVIILNESVRYDIAFEKYFASYN